MLSSPALTMQMAPSSSSRSTSASSPSSAMILSFIGSAAGASSGPGRPSWSATIGICAIGTRERALLRRRGTSGGCATFRVAKLNLHKTTQNLPSRILGDSASSLIKLRVISISHRQNPHSNTSKSAHPKSVHAKILTCSKSHGISESSDLNLPHPTTAWSVDRLEVRRSRRAVLIHSFIHSFLDTRHRAPRRPPSPERKG